MIFTGALTRSSSSCTSGTFKYGPTGEVAGQRDLYRLVIEVLQPPALRASSTWSAWCWSASTCGTASSSAFESLGVDQPRCTPRVLLTGKVLAVVIAGGFVFIPLWVFFVGGRHDPVTRHTAASSKLDAHVPAARSPTSGTATSSRSKLVNPANKRKYTVIVVGTGLAGASAAASLGELGYNVLNFCIQDSPRRAHSIAAQGGINAAKNYQNDGDSV